VVILAGMIFCLIRYSIVNSLKVIGMISLRTSISIVEGGPIDILKNFLSSIE